MSNPYIVAGLFPHVVAGLFSRSVVRSCTVRLDWRTAWLARCVVSAVRDTRPQAAPINATRLRPANYGARDAVLDAAISYDLAGIEQARCTNR
jgi:hypothetical protein